VISVKLEHNPQAVFSINFIRPRFKRYASVLISEAKDNPEHMDETFSSHVMRMGACDLA
jgi:hypothetical protein